MVTNIPKEIRDYVAELRKFAQSNGYRDLGLEIDKWYERLRGRSKVVLEDGKIKEIRGATWRYGDGRSVHDDSKDSSQ